MSMGGLSKVLQRIRQAVPDGGETDAQLLRRFAAGHDESAFEALLRRHGPMVLGVCRRVLGHHHDAEDAFQATFLVLARKAGAVNPRERVAAWLHGVAFQVARKARALATRRRGRETPVAELPDSPTGPP